MTVITNTRSKIPTETLARIVAQLSLELNVRRHQVAAVIDLINDGATIPFIARYRKEATGGLDDTVLRNLDTRLLYLRELEDRRAAILASITEQQKLTPQLAGEINQADTKQRLEDLYAPYKPKRRTRAQIAREAGLEPLADAILADAGCDPVELAAGYLNPDAGVADAKAALDGARDILAELESEKAMLDTLTAKVVAEGLATLTQSRDPAQGTDGQVLIVRGQSHLLDSVEAQADIERVRTLFEDIERKNDLIRLMELAKDGAGVSIFIGSENRLFSLSGSSIVAAPYANAAGKIVGVIGVLGPTRLNYGRIIPMVDHTAKVIGRLLA